MNTNDKEYKISQLEEAKDHLEQAIELIEEAVQGTTLEARALQYIIPTLKMSLDNNHEFMGKNQNIEEMIEELENEDAEEDDNEEEEEEEEDDDEEDEDEDEDEEEEEEEEK